MRKRTYNNLPDPTEFPEEFNQYLRDNNKVILENLMWIVIQNKYIENQLVAFCKYPISNIHEYEQIQYPSRDLAFYWLFKHYSGKHIYINADEDKSVPNRLHFHIKLWTNTQSSINQRILIMLQRKLLNPWKMLITNLKKFAKKKGH
jgi:hypothetical protein